MKQLGPKSRYSMLALACCLFTAATGFSGTPSAPTDGQIESAIERRFAMDTRIDAGTVGVTVDKGHAVLTGTADSIEAKKHASKVASSVSGVKSVLNDLRVDPRMTDAQKIKHAVKHNLMIHDLLFDNNIAVRIDEGVVFLEGTVQTRAQRRLAERAAEAVQGVAAVENLLQTVDAPRSDEVIKEDIVQYLLYSPLADNEAIDVIVKNGVVTLKGEVPHLAYRDALAIDIENIHGVEEVKTGHLIPEGLAASDQKRSRHAQR